MKLKIALAAILAATLGLSVHAAKSEKLSSGFFVASNKTDHTVTIKVGNFIPTSYTIKPHSSKTILVSTSNQNIEIDSIS